MRKRTQQLKMADRKFRVRVYLLSKAIHIVATATKSIGGIVYDALKFLHHILYHDAPQPHI